MERVSRTWWWEIGVATIAILLGAFLRAFVFEWALQETVPYVVFLAAIVAAAYYGGWKAGVWATLFGAVVCSWYWLPDGDPRPDFTLSDVIRFPIFVGTGLVLSAIIHALRAAQRLAQTNERALRSQQQLWRDTLASIGDGVVATDAEHRIVFLNAAAEGLCGWTQQEAEGCDVTLVLQLRDEQNDEVRENPAIRAVRENHIVALNEGTCLVNGRGERFDVELVAAPISNDARPADLGAVLVFRDITRRRQYERQLQEVDRRKDEFLATLAHELRTPLAVINTTVDMMQMEVDAHPRMRQLTDVLGRQQRQLSCLIDDLVDVSRISRGVIALKRERVDLREIVDAAIETSQPVLDRFEHTLRVEQCEQPLPADADPVRINQIVVNLLNNAAKYTPPGGNIRVTTSAGADQATICVEDDGIGLANEDLPRIFEMFTQVGQALQDDTASLGIGLTLVKRLVELHGGTITALSDGVGRGSRFVVTLPMLQGLPATSEAVTMRASRQGVTRPTVTSPFRVLVVEDDADGREMFSQLLTMLGHEVESAADTASAWAIAERMQPEIIFSDISLPDASGYDFARRIRSAQPLQEVYLVAITGYAGPHDRDKALAAGFNEHLIKPVGMPRLQQIFLERREQSSLAPDDDPFATKPLSGKFVN